jgi:hypothetical protein
MKISNRASFRWASIVAAIVLTACASGPARTSKQSSSSKPTADQWALAAVEALQIRHDSALALADIQRATQMEPQRADLTWLWLSLCVRAQGCAPEPIEVRMRKLDVGNGAVWIGPLARAQAERDVRSEEQILIALGKAQRFDVYWNSLLWRLASIRARAAPADQRLAKTVALNDVAGMLSAVILPSLQPLATACSAERMAQQQTIARCKLVAQVLEKGDSYAAEGVGLGIEQRIYRDGTPEAVVLADRIQNLRYRRDTAAGIIESQVEREKFSEQYVELLKKLPREQDVTDAILRWAGEDVAR